MASLAAAHRGYEYQDLLVAARLVDVLLGVVIESYVDEKQVEDDRFDDLTTLDFDNTRDRTQFKHTENANRPLTLATFMNDGRGLRLDRLISCMLADKAGPGCNATSATFRVVLRDSRPDDARLTEVLHPASPDPGPFLAHMDTARLAFDADALWAQMESCDGAFAFLKANLADLSEADLAWACGRLVIEVDSPAASGDLTSPGPAEVLLLERTRRDIGAEAFPNAHRLAVDVAAALISAARAARQGRVRVTPDELLRRARLRSDFGAVTRSHPVDPTTEVQRAGPLDELVATATLSAERGGYLVVTGPPGHGKSWLCQQLLDELTETGWLVAEHYCFLGDADGERLERVLTDNLFGSLIARLAQADPALVEHQRPRFAADEEVLTRCVVRARERDASRPVALVVDGLDHITRVRDSPRSRSDPSLAVVEALNGLELPPGCVLIVLSQPGPHLAPLEGPSTSVLTVPGLDTSELRQLAERQQVIASADLPLRPPLPLLQEPDLIAEFVSALAEHSQGNALYATYLCREVLREDTLMADPASTISHLPPFDGTLERYYEHLHQALGGDAGWVADVIAVTNFGISRTELREIMPEFAHRVDDALRHLAPVLDERAARGVRIYHESFARFLRQAFTNEPAALTALLNRVGNWLDSKGLFTDSRAYRHLLPLLAEADEDARLVELVGLDFVERSIASAFPAEAITRNLGTAIRAAAAVGSWPLIVRYVELSRAAEAFQNERYDSTLVEFADVYIALLGDMAVAERMLDDGRRVVPARAGLQMCAAIDRIGGVAPWHEYMVGYLRESEGDSTDYGEASDLAVATAWARGRLRLAAGAPGESDAPASQWQPQADEIEEASEDLFVPIYWQGLAEWLDDNPTAAPDVTAAVLETHGPDGLMLLLRNMQSPGSVCLAAADLVVDGRATDAMCSARTWATAAVAHGVEPGAAYRLLALGVDVDDLAVASASDSRARLLELTSEVQQPNVQWEVGALAAWLDLCAVAARRDPLALDLVDGSIIGEGWYRCWLRFVVALAKAEAAPAGTQAALSLEAISRLTDDLHPFSGDPRSCDLYRIHGHIASSIRRAIHLLDDERWAEGIRTLKTVSDGISTTLSGEIGGPVPVDLILDLAVTTSIPCNRGLADALIEEEIEAGSGGRYYSDLACYRLHRARLALTAGDSEAAGQLWRQACALLAGYGWHKDITIYELLDPLPSLIELDPARGRRRVADVQGVCERVPLHTDRRGTRGAWGRWWTLLAQADPAALSSIAARSLLAECNEPNALLYDAVDELWRAAAGKADPVVAGALRLSIDSPLEPGDADILKRLLVGPDAHDQVLRRLLTMLMARLDERPVSYSVTNSEEILATDDAQANAVNSVALCAGLPPSLAFRDAPPRDRNGFDQMPSARARARVASEPAPAAFAPGAVGLGRAMRAWRSRPYDADTPDWSTDRFTAVIGYRLVELAEQGRAAEAASAIQTLADFIDYGDRSSILQAVAEGLERHDLRQLSAIAYALAWTRTRGHGGWLSFGGETAMDSLRRATMLDAEAVRAVVSDEVERFVTSGRHGTYGISQALILALATGCLVPDQAADAAFDAWDEALAVISARAPIVHASDEPDDQYMPPANDRGEAIVGDLDTALAIAMVAGMAHPSRERKRRTLMAIELLISLRPDLAAGALATALAQECDPATHSWLLWLLEKGATVNENLVAPCEPALAALAASNYLSVRAAARRLLGTSAPALPPPSSPDPALMRDKDDILWAPGADDENGKRTNALVLACAGRRIRLGERELPGLGQVVRSRVASQMKTDAYSGRLKAQIDSFADRLRERWPDAYLANEQLVEESLQLVAATGRAARMIAGEPVPDPAVWEDALGKALLDDPLIPLVLEATRHPRPSIPPVPSRHADLWIELRHPERGLPVKDDDEQLVATVSIEPTASAPTVMGGQFDGWTWLGTVEERTFDHPDFRRREPIVGCRYRIIEVRDQDDTTSLTLPPVSAGDLRAWRFDVDPAHFPEFGMSQPLVGIDRSLKIVGDGRRTLGVPSVVLTPTPDLLAALGLAPVEDIAFADQAGTGLTLLTWRADYDRSDYHLPMARATGAGIAIRSDLLARLHGFLGSRLVLRDFVVASADLAGSTTTDADEGAGLS